MKITAYKKNTTAGTDYYRINQPDYAEIMTDLIQFVCLVGEQAQTNIDIRRLIFEARKDLPRGRNGMNSAFSYACGLIQQQTERVRDFSKAQLDALDIILPLINSKHQIERVG